MRMPAAMMVMAVVTVGSRMMMGMAVIGVVPVMMPAIMPMTSEIEAKWSNAEVLRLCWLCTNKNNVSK